MDDPLIGLTIWHSRDTPKQPAEPTGPGRPVRVPPRNPPAPPVDSNKLQDSRQDKKKAVVSKQKKRLPATGKRLDNSDGHSDCLPCLPSIEDLEEEEREKGFSSGSEGVVTPEPSGDATAIFLNSPVPQPQNYWLMRLFSSNLFDMSIAIGYLFNSKESDVQAYLGNKLFVSPSRWLVSVCLSVCVCWGASGMYVY